MSDIIYDGKPETPVVEVAGGVTINPGDITIGAVSLQDDATHDTVNIADVSTITEASVGMAVKDPSIGLTDDAEASGDGSVIGVLKRIRTLLGNLESALAGGLPVDLGTAGGLKVAVVDGSVVVNSSALPSGASTEAKQDTGNSSLSSIDGKLPALSGGKVPTVGPLTDTELRATPVPVSGTVTATGPLTDAQLRNSAVPVSGPLTDAQLRNSAVPVSGTVTATGPLTDAQLRNSAVPISGTVTATGPLTDTQLRLTPVPVSGTVTASGPLTDTQLRATPVPVSGTVTATGPLTDAQLRLSAVPVSGTVTANAGWTETAPTYVRFPRYDMTPFGAVRVAADFLAFEQHNLYPGQATAYNPDVYGYEKDAGSKGSITHLPNFSALHLAVSDGTNGAKSRLRTHDFIRYQLGAATHIKQTFFAGDAPAGTSIRVVVRSSTSGSVVDTPVSQASWNVNTYGSLDVTKGNLYEIKVEWLGVGLVEWYVAGQLVHVSSHPNTLAAPYMKTAILPLSVEILNTASARIIRVGMFDDSDGVFWEIYTTTPGAGSVTLICNSARILNGCPYHTMGYGFTAAAAVTANANTLPLFSMRMGTTLNGIANRAMALPDRLNTYSEGGPTAYMLILNPTLTGATYAATSPSEAVQLDTAATALSGGTTLWRTGVADSVANEFNLGSIFEASGRKLRLQAFTGTSDVLTVAYMRETNANVTPRATLSWKSIR